MIQWNSSTAQETLTRLRRTVRGMQDCLRQAKTARAALEQANPDGENQTLRKALECFDGCEQRLNRLLDDLESYKTGVRKANDRFEEAEQSALRVVNKLSAASSAPVTGAAMGRVNWDPTAYGAIPEIRVHAAPVPSWLENAAAGADAGRF